MMCALWVSRNVFRRTGISQGLENDSSTFVQVKLKKAFRKVSLKRLGGMLLAVAVLDKESEEVFDAISERSYPPKTSVKFRKNSL
jgi:hypothetical protein